MVTANRNQFSNDSNRKDEWNWHNMDEDWRVCIADQGVTRPNRFNIILDTDLYESKYSEGRILGNTRVHAETVYGYENAMARAVEIMTEAEERVAEHNRES